MPGLQNTKSTLAFLDTIGSSDRGDNVSLSNTAAVLVELAQFLIDTATANMQKGANIASGETASSMKAVNLNTNTNKMSIEVEILSTYKFLDQGVKGTKSGAGKYSFKNDKVSKKMATAIFKWVRRRSLSGKAKYKAKGKNEAKNKRLRKIVSKSDNYKSLAYAMATSIKQRGIKRTLFWTKALQATQAETKKKIGDAFKIDVINSLNSLNNN